MVGLPREGAKIPNFSAIVRKSPVFDGPPSPIKAFYSAVLRMA
jgi:hypothetical protein